MKDHSSEQGRFHNQEAAKLGPKPFWSESKVCIDFLHPLFPILEEPRVFEYREFLSFLHGEQHRYEFWKLLLHEQKYNFIVPDLNLEVWKEFVFLKFINALISSFHISQIMIFYLSLLNSWRKNICGSFKIKQQYISFQGSWSWSVVGKCIFFEVLARIYFSITRQK
jgi:hypothetical protein